MAVFSDPSPACARDTRPLRGGCPPVRPAFCSARGRHRPLRPGPCNDSAFPSSPSSLLSFSLPSPNRSLRRPHEPSGSLQLGPLSPRRLFLPSRVPGNHRPRLPGGEAQSLQPLDLGTSTCENRALRRLPGWSRFLSVLAPRSPGFLSVTLAAASPCSDLRTLGKQSQGSRHATSWLVCPVLDSASTVTSAPLRGWSR